jgi:peptide deformylase
MLPQILNAHVPEELKELRKKSKRVANIDDTCRNVCVMLIDCMYANQGIGLAAPQVGIHKRIIIVDDNGYPLTLINPEITATSSNKVTLNEGCLSVPEHYEDKERPESITVKYRNLKGRTVKQTFIGLLSRIIQHEIDHLDGIIFTDNYSL